jgi:L-alanine-DL-glutamate epimerase-like enolase superfamily enzyme
MYLYFSPFNSGDVEEQARRLRIARYVVALSVENGYIALPQGPGLGLELREEVLGRYPYREFPLRHLPTYRDEGP